MTDRPLLILRQVFRLMMAACVGLTLTAASNLVGVWFPVTGTIVWGAGIAIMLGIAAYALAATRKIDGGD